MMTDESDECLVRDFHCSCLFFSLVCVLTEGSECEHEHVKLYTYSIVFVEFEYRHQIKPITLTEMSSVITEWEGTNERTKMVN